MTVIDVPTPPQHLIEQSVRVIQPAPVNSGSGMWQEEPPKVYRFTVRSAAAPWLREAVAAVSQLTALRADWDTYGAKAIDASAAARVAEFLLDHAYHDLTAPAVVPMSDGGIQLEWHRGGVDLEISFSNDDPGVYVEDLETGEVSDEPFDAAASVLVRYRGRLAS